MGQNNKNMKKYETSKHITYHFKGTFRIFICKRHTDN